MKTRAAILAERIAPWALAKGDEIVDCIGIAAEDERPYIVNLIAANLEAAETSGYRSGLEESLKIMRPRPFRPFRWLTSLVARR